MGVIVIIIIIIIKIKITTTTTTIIIIIISNNINAAVTIRNRKSVLQSSIHMGINELKTSAKIQVLNLCLEVVEGWYVVLVLVSMVASSVRLDRRLWRGPY